MRKTSIGLAVFTIAVAAGTACAQDLAIPDVQYPKIATYAESPDGFVPAGWKLESLARGDLNGDALPDIVLVLRDADPANLIDAGLPDKLDTNPRMLVVALGRAGGGYYLAVDNHTLITRTDNPQADDYYASDKGIDIAGGALHVHLRYFAYAGSWSASTSKFTFRYRGGDLELIGFDEYVADRGSGETNEVSLNYLTRRVKITRGALSGDPPDKVSWQTLPDRPLRTIKEVGDGLEYNDGLSFVGLD